MGVDGQCMKGLSKARPQIAICKSPFHTAAASEFIPINSRTRPTILQQDACKKKGGGFAEMSPSRNIAHVPRSKNYHDSCFSSRPVKKLGPSFLI